MAGTIMADEVRLAGGVTGQPAAAGPALVTASFRDMVSRAEMAITRTAASVASRPARAAAAAGSTRAAACSSGATTC